MIPEGNPGLEGGSWYNWEKQADISVPCSLKIALEAAPAFCRTEDTGRQSSPYLSLPIPAPGFYRNRLIRCLFLLCEDLGDRGRKRIFVRLLVYSQQYL